MIASFNSARASAQHPGGKGRSIGILALHLPLIRKALSDAVRLRRLRFNPAKDARLPRRQRPTTAASTADEAAAFLVAIRDDRWFAMWRLVLAAGLRRGELLGLRWSDLDLAALGGWRWLKPGWLLSRR